MVILSKTAGIDWYRISIFGTTLPAIVDEISTVLSQTKPAHHHRSGCARAERRKFAVSQQKREFHPRAAQLALPTPRNESLTANSKFGAWFEALASVRIN
jgi:hypothetical protein